MTRNDMVDFEHIMTHYISLALMKAGVEITNDIRAELSAAFVKLESAIQHLIRDEMSQRAMELSGDW